LVAVTTMSGCKAIATGRPPSAVCYRERVGPRRRSRRARRVTATRKVAPRPRAPSAETLLLALARAVSERVADRAPAPDVAALVETLAAAYAPGAPLEAALRATPRPGAGDKSAELALGFAREQVRLAMLEVVESGRAAHLVRRDTDAETLAWLWLAACESLAHEPPPAVPDRVQALTAFLTAASAGA
jgi:hypothetical protein